MDKILASCRFPERKGEHGEDEGKRDTVTWTISDEDFFDCPICCEPLTIPVFECENGHIACSSCCTNIEKKCPSCKSSLGYFRNRAMEKVLELVQVRCKNAKYGCKETIGFIN